MGLAGRVSEERPLSTAEALRDAVRFLSRHGVEGAWLDAEVLLAAALGVDRAALHARDERPLAATALAEFRRLLERRAGREPLAYILGKREFWSLEFLVTPDVLIPRPETELLVERVLELLPPPSGERALRCLELGTGSGAIAVSLARERQDLAIWATDVSAAALEVARRNAMRHGVAGRVRFAEGDLFEPVEGVGPFDAIVANPPYVPRGELRSLPPEVREWEPHRALDGGEDGLDFYRRILGEAARHLSPAGLLALEIGPQIVPGLKEILDRLGRGFDWEIASDYAGRERLLTLRSRGADG